MLSSWLHRLKAATYNLQTALQDRQDVSSNVVGKAGFLVLQLTLGPVRTEYVHTFLILSDINVRRGQNDHNTRIVWSCHVVQWLMSEYHKVKNASKSALRFAVQISGFILARNITPHCFLLRLLSFLLSSFRSYSWFPFCLLFVYLIWFLFVAFLPFFPHDLTLLLVSFLPLSLFSQFPFICLSSCFLLLLYWHFSSWPFYIQWYIG